MRTLSFLLVAAGAIGCGGTSASNLSPDMTPASDAGVVGEHGRVVDYFNLTPLAGFTVTDGTNTTTTDSDGRWVLPAPMGVVLAPVVTGPSYSTLQLGKAQAMADDVNVGAIPIPSTATFMTELTVTGADPSKALVQVIIAPTGACTSVAGGTLTIKSPTSASLAYFSPSGFPGATAISDTVQNRPAAVLFNLDTDATIELELEHPTCKLAPAGTVYNGAVFDGVGKLSPSEPGDNNSTLLLVAQ